MVTRWWPTHQINSADFTPRIFADLTFIIWIHIWPPSYHWPTHQINLLTAIKLVRVVYNSQKFGMRLSGGALSFAIFTHKGSLCKLVRMIYNFHKFGMCESRYDRKMQIYLKALYMTPGHLSHLFLGGAGPGHLFIIVSLVFSVCFVFKPIQL